MTSTINASTSAGIVQTADTSGILALQGSGVTFLTGASGQTTALQGGTQSSGTGIAFPAAQNASSDVNTLDDYEEGTWTPVDNSGAGLVFTSGIGRYVKVGKLVKFWFRAQYPSTSNASAANIGGLPYVSASIIGSFDVSGGWNTFFSQNFNDALSGYVSPSGTSVSVFGMVALQSVAKTNANLTSFNIYGYGSYYTAN